MIPILYDKTGKVKLGELVDIIDSGYVEEERNGIFEFTIDYPVGYPLSDLIVEENMIETKPNEEQGLQKFRIYDTKRLMKNVISVFARHESFDLANDHAENINLENASCEYALNTLFRNSHFSTNYRGYSDIINAQNYKIDNVNILNAIAGKKGSIIDTYGTGAEILRDNTNIHVLNKRGHDNGLTIEFGKNLTDFVLERDLTDLETRVGGFAKYTTEDNKEVVVKSNWIDSPYIDNFAHPYICREGRRDYSDKFKEGEIPTVEKLDKLCADEFKINKRDIPKSNYTIKFIPLSKCVGYEGIQDKISLCDTVRIIDKRFNVDTKAKVIKYKYDFIKERYESMELGEPRTTLGDIITGSNGNQGPPGKDGEQGPPGKDGNIENMPDTLPATPVLTAKVYGMGSVELSWTFENKLYYSYELYASRTRDFVPNTFDLIHEGQTSSFMFKANPGETWYFKVCAINSHNNRTPFSNQAEVTLTKIEDMNNYFSEMAIGKAVVQSLSADYMEAGIIKANWIELKGASVVDGNGKRTLGIDSFGNVSLDVSQLKINSKGVATSLDLEEANKHTASEISVVNNNIQLKVSKDEIISSINQTAESIKILARLLELNGATSFVSNHTNTYAKIVDACYSIVTENIRSMYIGGWEDSTGKFKPVFYMGKNGFNSSSSDVDGTYFSMEHDGKIQRLSARNKFTGKWSTVEFDAENQQINFVPESKCYTPKPFHFGGGVHVLNELGDIVGAFTSNGVYTNRITAYSGDTVWLGKNVAFENGAHSFTCNKIYIDTLLCNSDGKFWGNAYSSFKPIRESSGTSYLGTDVDRWNMLYCKQPPNVSSDIRTKENVEYVDEELKTRLVNNQESITSSDMREFIKSDLKIAEYNYIGEDKKTYNFIAQDIANTKVGKKIITKDANGYLGYDLGAYLNIAICAMQEEIRVRDSQISTLEEKLNKIENEIRMLKEGV